MLVAAAMASWPLSAGADTEHVVVVVIPTFRPASPPPPRIPNPASAAMGAAFSDRPNAGAADSHGSLLCWR